MIQTELRHLDGLVGGIAVSESEYMSTTALKRKELLIIGSTVMKKKLFTVDKYIFDTFWEKAIPAQRRIKEIEENLVREFIKTIQDPEEIRKLIPQMILLVNEEIQILFPCSNTFQIYQEEGILNLLKEKAEVEKRNMIVRILVKKDGSLNDLIDSLFSQLQNVQVLQSSSIDAKVATMIVDKDRSLVIEMADDSQHDILETVGLATYSNSQATVLSYDSIFEMGWVQAEMQHRKV
jgi:two-component system, OmpR family, sensor histidine kinase VicK